MNRIQSKSTNYRRSMSRNRKAGEGAVAVAVSFLISALYHLQMVG